MARLLGTAPCTGPGCSEKVAVNLTEGGSLSCKCQICKWSSFAPPGSRAARNLRAVMTPIEDGDDPADPPAAPKPAPLEVKKPTSNPPKPKPPTPVAFAFDLGQLT